MKPKTKQASSTNKPCQGRAYLDALTYTFGILLCVTFLSGIVLSSSRTYADNDSVTDEVNITVPVACTMGGSIATGNEHTATLLPGTYSGTSGSGYEQGIGKTTLTAYCNDYNGFSIYAIGYTNDTDGDNTMLGTSASGNATIPTKVYESTDTTSNWSMKVNKVTDSTISYNPASMTIQDNFDSWHAVPSEYAKVAEYKASTGSSATDTTLGAKVETTYAAYISSTQPADTYTGKVKYVMVHPYDATAPEKLISIAEATTMQEVNTCPADLPEEVVYTIKDSRDNQDYKVAKLKDGKCWMVENLNLAGGTKLSSDTTDFPSTYITPTDQGWKSDGGLPDSSTTGFTQNNYAYVYNSDNKTNCGNENQDALCYSYYSWDAATIGSGRNISRNENAPYSICPKNWHLPTTNNYDSADGSDIQTLLVSYGGSESILEYSSSTNPTGLEMYNKLKPNTIPNYTLAGLNNQGTWSSGGTFGGYWTSTSSDYYYQAAYVFAIIQDDSVKKVFNHGRSNGFSIRCLFSN